MNAIKPTPLMLSIVIPAYNEAANLPAVIRDTMATLDASETAGRYELLVVNDGSSDETGNVAEALAGRFPCVRVLHHSGNQGLGSGLRTGFASSRGDYVGWLPADGEVQADQVLVLLRNIGAGDIINSTRIGYLVENRVEHRSFYRGLLTWCFQKLCTLLVGFNPSRYSGVYLLRGAFIRSLTLYSKTGLVGLEILAHSFQRRADMRLTETTVCHRLSGRSKVATFEGIVKQVWELFKIRSYVRRSGTVADGSQSKAA